MRHRERPPRPAHLADADALTATELRIKYKLTYSSWRNMKTLAKTEGVPVDREFVEFRSFLRHMGPRLAKDLTVDRHDRETYSPMTCTWENKRKQANNRSTTIFITCDGLRLPLAEWAERTGQRQGTLRNRKYKRYSDWEVIHGKEGKPLLSGQGFGRNPFEWRPWPEFWPGDRKTQDALEASFKQNRRRGGEEYRIHFLIDEACKRYNDDAAFLALYREDNLPSMRAEIKMRDERLARVRSIRDRAQALLPDWEVAAEKWERGRRDIDPVVEPEQSGDDNWHCD